jgi:hypothetical protein
MTTMPDSYTAATAPAAPKRDEMTDPDSLDALGVRIPFGEKPNESVPASWAAAMLGLLRDRDVDLFVSIMGEVVTGHRMEPKSRAGRPRSDGAQ